MPGSERAENMIRLGGYYPKLNFGFAGGTLCLHNELFSECSQRSAFTALEILPDQFHFASDLQKEVWKSRFQMIHCGPLLDETLVCQIPGEEGSLRKEFFRTVELLLSRLQQDSIPAGILDFGLGSILGDESRKKSLARLLHQMRSVLYRTGRTLLLPLTIPVADPSVPGRTMAFLRELMIPQLKICLYITPHELQKNFSPADLAGSLYLETASVYFRYQADCGNTLKRVHLVPWLRYFARGGFRGPFFYCPVSRENRLASVQSLACSRLTEELKSSGSVSPERK